MFNPRLLIQIPLLLLGSCTPLSPANNTQIVIYTGDQRGADERPRAQAVTQVAEDAFARQGPVTRSEKCEILELAQLKTYVLPPIPNLGNIDPDDNKAIVDALLDNIELLRKEITKLQRDYRCTLEKRT